MSAPPVDVGAAPQAAGRTSSRRGSIPGSPKSRPTSSDDDFEDDKTSSGDLCHRTVLDPRTNNYVAYWDLVTTLALVFTALVTPYEVAFLSPPPVSARMTNGLFWTNRVVDMVFILDMVLQFRMVYKKEDVREGTRWITDGRQIAKHYLFSFWFVLDFFSVSTLVFDFTGNDDTEDLKVLRTVRTLRLIKLVKLLRGSRILKRWEMHLSINYSYLTLSSVMIAIVLTCHWTACLWGIQALFEPLDSWPGSFGDPPYCIE